METLEQKVNDLEEKVERLLREKQPRYEYHYHYYQQYPHYSYPYVVNPRITWKQFDNVSSGGSVNPTTGGIYAWKNGEGIKKNSQKETLQ